MEGNLNAEKSNSTTRQLGHFLLCAGMFLLLASVLAAMRRPFPANARPGEPATKAEDFVGTWRARFKDKTFALLKLKKDEGSLAGAFAAGDINTNEDGDVVEVVSEANGEQDIQSAKLADGKLSFQVKDEDGPTEFEFTLSDAAHGRLKIMVPPGGPKLNPFAMIKDEAKP